MTGIFHLDLFNCMQTCIALLAAASQRIEYLILDWFGNDYMHEILREWVRKERGALPGLVETGIIIYVQGDHLKYNSKV